MAPPLGATRTLFRRVSPTKLHSARPQDSLAHRRDVIGGRHVLVWPASRYIRGPTAAGASPFVRRRQRSLWQLRPFHHLVQSGGITAGWLTAPAPPAQLGICGTATGPPAAGKGKGKEWGICPYRPPADQCLILRGHARRWNSRDPGLSVLYVSTEPVSSPLLLSRADTKDRTRAPGGVKAMHPPLRPCASPKHLDMTIAIILRQLLSGDRLPVRCAFGELQ